MLAELFAPLFLVVLFVAWGAQMTYELVTRAPITGIGWEVGAVVVCVAGSVLQGSRALRILRRHLSSRRAAE